MMKIKYKQRLILFAFFLLPALAKPQLIKDEFLSPVFSDQFDDDKDTWRNMSTSDNLFLIQDGEYLLRRKNTASGYSIFPKWSNKLTTFSLTASMKLEDSKNPEASIGLIFMAQEDATGAFIFEFNPKGQYRLKQLVGLSFKLLTGDQRNNGWVDSDALNPLGQYNIIEIRTSKRNYDIYANEKYLLSFTEIAYKSGDIGFSIGAATKARVDFITVKEPKNEEVKSSQQSGKQSNAGQAANTKPSNPDGAGVPDASGQASGNSDLILKLVEQVSSLKVENQMLRDSLRLVKKQLRAANMNKSNPDPGVK